MKSSTRAVMRGAALLVGLVGGSHCTSPAPAPRAEKSAAEPAAPPPPPRDGRPACEPGARVDLLAVQARECWFAARHGHWRIVDHHSHYDSVVVRVRATDVRDAEQIADDFVTRGAHRELLVYVHPELSTRPATVRRVRWTKGEGFDTLEFEGPALDDGAK